MRNERLSNYWVIEQFLQHCLPFRIAFPESELSVFPSLRKLARNCLILDTMKKMILLIVLSLSGAVMAQAPAPKMPGPMRPLEWLVGGVWTTDMSKMGNGMKSIETRYTWSDNGAFIRFNSHFITEKAVVYRYDHVVHEC